MAEPAGVDSESTCETNVDEGIRLLDAAVHAGALVPTRCGGVMECLACRVEVLTPNAVSPRGEKERQLLLGLQVPPTVRLACQARVLGPVRVRLLPRDDADDGPAL